MPRAGVIMFFPSAVVQLTATVLAAFASVCIVVGFAPYRERSDNLSGGALLVQASGGRAR